MSNTTITVIDSIMGSGKTSYIFDHMNITNRRGINWEEGTVSKEGFIYITPWLDEVKRVQAACPGLSFTDPLPKGGKKLNHFNDLVQEGHNVATTHSLFSMLNQESHESLMESDYTLVIDEETECVKEYDIKKDDIRALFEAGMVHINSDNRLKWNYVKYPDYQGRFSEIKALCDNGNLIQVNDSFWVWEFPMKFLRMFKQVYILTYLFEGSLLSTYLKANGVPYQMKSICEGELVEYTGDDTQVKRELIPLINIIDDPKLNAVGTPLRSENPLSKNWYRNDLKRGGKKVIQLQHNLENYFRNRVKGKSGENMYSTFKDFEGKLRGKGYTKGFTVCNLKATNDYIDKKNLAYLVNVFVRPRLVQYFDQCGVEPDQDLYALSQMIQWVWRSQIRRGNSINLYIPSLRMRKLFKRWLYSEDDVGLRLVA